MKHPFRLAAVALLASLFVLDACNEPAEPIPKGLRVISGSIKGDSVFATFPPVVVELRDENGELVPNADIKISINKLKNSPLRGGAMQNSAYLYGDNFQLGSTDSTVTASTDSNGRLTVNVRAFQNSGVAQIVFVAPTSNSTATATFTIRAGDPVRLRAFPADTAVFLQRSYTLRGAVIDQFGNDAIGNFPVTYETIDNLVSVSPNGTVTGIGSGRTAVIARSAARADTAEITVLPTLGTFAVGNATQFGKIFDLNILNLDGSQLGKLATSLGYVLKPFDSYGDDWFMRSRWMPDGNALIVETTRILGVPRLWFVPADGAAPRRLIPQSTATAETWPAPSMDGQWIYYTRSPNLLIRRVHPDGTGDESIPTASPSSDPVEVQGAVSSDGTWLAWNNDPGFEPHISVRRIATGERTALSTAGSFPAWSPKENRLAYIVVPSDRSMHKAIRTVAFDGSNDQMVSDADFEGPLSWSPDGRFILAMHRVSGVETVFEVIEVATGKEFPLPFTRGMLNGAWRPK